VYSTCTRYPIKCFPCNHRSVKQIKKYQIETDRMKDEARMQCARECKTIYFDCTRFVCDAKCIFEPAAKCTGICRIFFLFPSEVNGISFHFNASFSFLYDCAINGTIPEQILSVSSHATILMIQCVIQ
jgi:hypothetical protein